jgi:LysM repeat protein
MSKMFSLALVAGLASAMRTATIKLNSDSVSNSTVQGEIKGTQLSADEPIVYEANVYGLQPNSIHSWNVHSASISSVGNCSQALGFYDMPERADADADFAGNYENFQADAMGVAIFTYSDSGTSFFGDYAITTQAAVIGDDADSEARLACGNYNVQQISTNPGGPKKPETCSGQNIVCVQKGDTLFKISQTYKLKLDQLVAANPQFTDIDLIFPGDRVCIPEVCYPKRKPAVCNGEILTKVKSGDTLYKLALANDLELNTLIAANAQLGPDFDLIFPGDQV